jgi:glucodextranase-like protein/PASTA domain-containing protein
VCLLGLSACGGDEPSRPEPRVTVQLTAPADAAVVRSGAVEVAGEVRPPDASVTVLGRDASVTDGRFSARVALRPGANIVDVAATAAGRRAGFAALRVVREVRVRVPDLTGRDADAAAQQLAALGLQVELRRGGGLFDPLLPGDPSVCETRPGPGAELLPGTTVELVVARSCG